MALPARWTPQLLSLARVIFGFLLFRHGMEQVLGFPPAWVPSESTSFYGVIKLLAFPGGILIMLGLQSLTFSLVHHVPPHATPQQLEAHNMQLFIFRYLKIFFVFLLPMSAWLMYLFYRRHNYAEYCVINVFIAGTISLSHILLYVLFGNSLEADSKTMLYIQLLIAISYTTCMVSGLYVDLPLWKVLLYQVIITLLYYSFNVVLVMGAVMLFR